MFIQVQLVLLVAVAGTFCAPAVHRVGFHHGASGRTAVKAGANAKGTTEDGVANGVASAKLGASASGTVDGGVFVQNNNRITEAAADYHASAGGYINPSATGVAGKNSQTGQLKLGADGKWRSNGEQSSAGSAGIYTDDDALVKFNKAQNRNADDILDEMEDF